MKKQNVNKSRVSCFSDECEIFDPSDLIANEHSELFDGSFHSNAFDECTLNLNSLDFGYLSYRM
jgi:hypothetical protein